MCCTLVPGPDPLYQAAIPIPQLLWVLSAKCSQLTLFSGDSEGIALRWSELPHPGVSCPPHPLANDGLIWGYKGLIHVPQGGKLVQFMLQTHPLWIRLRLDFIRLYPCSCTIPSSPPRPQQITWLWILVSGSALGNVIWCVAPWVVL